MSRYFLTTPIYYVNDRPHIGHAYTSLACDAIARCKRLEGHAVHFMTGTDEHGQKVAKAARAAGEEPKDFTDRVSKTFRELVEEMNISADEFTRTTEPRHYEAVQNLWRRLAERGWLYLGTYSGWYAVRDEAYYDESELVRDEEGVRRAPSGAEVEWLEEPSWFFSLSKCGDALLRHYEQNPEFLAPDNRANEVISFVRSGLRDLSVSRTGFSWGVPVPDDDAHVIYVWLDALMIYMTAGGGTQAAEDGSGLWPADLHMVGKDIMRFHAVYWPAFLLAAELPLPKRVFGHGWLLNRGKKMSKSEGNVLRPAELIKRYGLDPLRYYLLREVPFGQDGYISHETIVARCNAELANGVGNLAQRSLSMVAKNLEGQAPGWDEPAVQALASAEDRALVREARALPSAVVERIGAQELHLALEEVWRIVGAANRYFDTAAPWKLAREGAPRLAAVLAATLESLHAIAICLLPFTPTSAAQLLRQLGRDEPLEGIRFGDAERSLPPRALPPPVPVFLRLED